MTTIKDLGASPAAVAKTKATLEVLHPSEKYLYSLLALLPRGPAWTRRLGSNLAQFLQGLLADEALRLEKKWEHLVDEADVRTTQDLVDDWERVLDLPDTCYAPTDLSERQEALHAKLTDRSAATEQHFVDLAEAVGFLVTMERHPYPAMRCNDPCNSYLNAVEWPFVFRAIIDSYGSSTDLLKCVLNRAKLLHTYCEVYKPRGVTWTSHAFASSNMRAYKVAHDGLSTYVAVGYDFSTFDVRIERSDDGATWSNCTVPSLSDYLWGVGVRKDGLNKLWVAVGGNSTGRVLTSPDGLAWTQQTPGIALPINGIDTDGSLWCAVGSTGGIYTNDADCVGSWTDRTSGSSTHHSVVYGDSLWVVVGNSGTIKTSSDTTSWDNRTPGGSYSGHFWGVTYSPELGLYCAVGTSGEIQTSTDGITWTHRTSGVSSSLRTVTYVPEDGAFWVVGDSATVLRSEDGVTWTDESGDLTGSPDFMGIAAKGRGIVCTDYTSNARRTLEGEY